MHVLRYRTMLAVLLLSAGSMAAASESSWWHICTSCQGPEEFRFAAMHAGGDEATIFVSNPNSLETKKFDRSTTWEERERGLVRTTQVSDREMTQQEGNALRRALEQASVFFAIIDAEQVNRSAGIPAYASAVQAIRHGRLENSFFFGLQAALYERELLSTLESVGLRAGTRIQGLSGATRIAGSLRTVPIALRVRYPDGSHISVVHELDGRWAHAFLVGAEGNLLDINLGVSMRPVVEPSLLGRYVFAGEGVEGAVRELASGINRSRPSALACTWNELPGQMVELVCPNS